MKQLSSILVVENNRHDQKLIRRTLKQNLPECKLTMVQSGESALVELNAAHFDVVLLDFELSAMSGLDILEKMKASGISTATIFVTGQGNEKIAVEAIQSGAQNYLVKDIASEYLQLLPLVVRQAHNQWHDHEARQRAEHALRENEETLRTTFTSMDDLVFVLNRAGVCIICYKPLGLKIKSIFTSSEVIGFHYSEVFPSSLAKPLGTSIKLVEQSQTVEEFDFSLETAVSLLWFNARVSPRQNSDHQYDGVTVVARNITDRKEAQQELEKQYQRQSALAELELAVNQPSELQKVLRQVVHIVTYLLPATAGASIILWDADNESYSVSASTVSHQPAGIGKNRVRKKGGATRWVIDHQQPVIVPDTKQDPFIANNILTDYSIHAYVGVPLLAEGKVLGVLYGMHLHTRNYPATDIDFLNRLAHRAALAIRKVQLYEQLQQKQADLEQQAADLVAQNAELQAFSSTVAHDLKNPLAMIKGYSDLLLEGESEQSDMFLQIVTTISKNSQKMAKIIDELLLLAQVRQKDVQLTPIVMHEIVYESMARLHYVIQQAQPQFVYPQDWPQVIAYGPWIEEVWTNYISNAIKYGGVPAKIELGFTQLEEEAVRFWIKDQGPGIPADKQSKLFMPFTQLKQIRAQGHGLGLSIVQRIVNKCGGDVGVDSEPGIGSTFWFTLNTRTDI